MKEKEFVKKFIELGKYEVDYSSKKSVKVNNKNAKKLTQMMEEIATDLDMASKAYGLLLKNDNPNISTIAASDCLRLGIHKEEAIKLLEKQSKRKDIGIIAFSAEMALKVYNGEIPGKKL
jgi:hypothetical protein